jgi:hypothetical protein
MANNYEDRKVARFEKGLEKGHLLVDTCLVTDANKPYETTVAHPAYNNNDLVVVELYNTKKEAKKGHDKWVKKITAKTLPKSLKDVSTASIAKLVDVVSNDKKWRTKLRKKEK